jgi:hypothetical protein
MQSRLTTIGDQIKTTLGPMAADYPVIRPESEKAFKRIAENVSKLQGNSPTPAAAQDAPSVPKISNPTDASAAYAQAKDAIAKGAPRDGVIARLKQMGLPATGL